MVDFIVSTGIALLSGLGVGSGGLLVVFLTEYRGVSQLFAQGVNLLFFIFSSGASTAVNLRTRNICYGSVMMMTAGGVAGAISGAYIASLVSPKLLKLAFGIMLIVSGVPSLIKAIGALLLEADKEKRKKNKE